MACEISPAALVPDSIFLLYGYSAFSRGVKSTSLELLRLQTVVERVVGDCTIAIASFK